tara:strand:+ start:1671 stop:4007 length:2337 start_codon:yes stop_codon:yes gene_type:complete
MIPHTQVNEVSSGGEVGVSKAYSFEMNAHMASMLSDKLYSNKPEAVVRELSCNAWDSHIMAGNEDPITVHLPTSIEPWLSIEDFGLGLHHNDMMDIYTSYGTSTKRTSNKVTGTFGLGTKVFFAYTDQATVTSTYEGVRTIYSCYKDKDGMPHITTMGTPQHDTQLRNGLKVYIGVLPGDMEAFKTAAESVFRRFDPRPVITGSSCDIKEYESVLDGSGWLLRKEADEYGGYGRQRESRKSYAVQGNVAYNISYDEMGPHISESSSIHFMLELPIDIVFKIGELDVASSREELSYNKQTIEAIISRYQEIYDELNTTLIPDLFGKCTNKWDASSTLNELLAGSSNNAYAKMIQNCATFQGKKIDREYKISTKALNPSYDPKINSYTNRYINSYDNVTFYIMSESRFALQTMTFTKDSCHETKLQGGGDYLILRMDSDVYKGPSRLKQYLLDTYGAAVKNSYYHNTTTVYPTIFIIKGATDSEWISIEADLGGHEYHNFDTLIPEAPKVVRRIGGGTNQVKRAATIPIITMFTGDSKCTWKPQRTSLREQWVDTSVDVSARTSGFYVNLKAWEVQYCDDIGIGYTNIFSLVQYAINIGLITKLDTIYGVPGSVRNPFKDQPGWQELSQVVYDNTLAWFSRRKNCVALKVNEALHEAKDRYGEGGIHKIINLLTGCEKYGTIVLSSVAKEFSMYLSSYNLDPIVITYYSKIQEGLLHNKAIYANLEAVDIEKTKVQAKLKDYEQKFNKKYPLLMNLDGYTLTEVDVVSAVCDYIKLKEIH